MPLQATCRELALTLQTAPARVCGSSRTALRSGLRLAVHPSCLDEEICRWKPFCLAPRMLLYGIPLAWRVPRSYTAELDRRCDLFRSGRWADLLSEAAAARHHTDLAAGPSQQTLAGTPSRSPCQGGSFGNCRSPMHRCPARRSGMSANNHAPHALWSGVRRGVRAGLSSRSCQWLVAGGPPRARSGGMTGRTSRNQHGNRA